MKKVLGLIVVAALAFGAVSLFAPQLLGGPTGGSPASATSPTGGLNLIAEKGASAAEEAKNTAINTVLDATGLKQAVDTTLRERGNELSWYLGIDQSTILSTVDAMAIQDWQIAQLPAGATPTASLPLDYNGTAATLTAYDDPGYVTLDAYGQTLTLAVPESAREGMRMLGLSGQY